MVESETLSLNLLRMALIRLAFIERSGVLPSSFSQKLRCLVCQGQSVYDSDSEFAVSLKLVVENKIQQGLTEDQIYQFLTDKYGEWILYDPKFNKNTYLLWFLPLLILLLGGAIIVKKLIKN